MSRKADERRLCRLFAGARAALPFVIVIGRFGMLFSTASAEAGLNLFEISGFVLTWYLLPVLIGQQRLSREVRGVPPQPSHGPAGSLRQRQR